MKNTRTILSTSAFWLLCFSFGTLYMLFTGMEIRLPAGNAPHAEYSQADQDGLNMLMDQASHSQHAKADDVFAKAGF